MKHALSVLTAALFVLPILSASADEPPTDCDRFESCTLTCPDGSRLVDGTITSTEDTYYSPITDDERTHGLNPSVDSVFKACLTRNDKLVGWFLVWSVPQPPTDDEEPVPLNSASPLVLTCQYDNNGALVAETKGDPNATWSHCIEQDEWKDYYWKP